MSYQVQMERRAAQPYAAIAVRVPVDGLAGAVDQGFPELFGWLASHDIQIAAAPFIRYLVVDMASDLQVELGAPVNVSSTSPSSTVNISSKSCRCGGGPPPGGTCTAVARRP